MKPPKHITKTKPCLSAGLALLVLSLAFSHCSSHEIRPSAKVSFTAPARSTIEELMAESYAQKDWDRFFGLDFVYFRMATGPLSERAQTLRALALLRHCRHRHLKNSSQEKSAPLALQKNLAPLTYLEGQNDLGQANHSKPIPTFSTSFQWKMSAQAALHNDWRSLRMSVKSFCSPHEEGVARPSRSIPGTFTYPQHSLRARRSDFHKMREALSAIESLDLETAYQILWPLFNRDSSYKIAAARLLVSLTEDANKKAAVIDFLIHMYRRPPHQGNKRDLSRLLFQRGLIHYHHQHYDQAKTFFDRSLEIPFQVGLVTYWKAFALWHLRQYEKAFHLWCDAKDKLDSEFHDDLLLDMADAARSLNPQSIGASSWLSRLSLTERMTIWTQILKSQPQKIGKNIGLPWLPLMAPDQKSLVASDFVARDLYFDLLSHGGERQNLLRLALSAVKPSPFIIGMLGRLMENLPTDQWKDLNADQITSFLQSYPDQVLWIRALESGLIKATQVASASTTLSISVRFVAQSLQGESLTSEALQDIKPEDHDIAEIILNAQTALNEIKSRRFSSQFSEAFLKDFAQWNQDLAQIRSLTKNVPEPLLLAWRRSIGEPLAQEIKKMETVVEALTLQESDPESQALFDKRKKSIINRLRSLTI